jgi:hypothetical protein
MASECVLTNQSEFMISEYKMGPINLVALTAHHTPHITSRDAIKRETCYSESTGIN